MQQVQREVEQEQCVDSIHSDKLGIGANVYVCTLSNGLCLLS